MAVKKSASKQDRGGDQYLMRLPPGLRERIAARAAENGRSMSAEIVAAIERHLRDADKFTEISVFIERHRDAIESLGQLQETVHRIQRDVSLIDAQVDEMRPYARTGRQED